MEEGFRGGKMSGTGIVKDRIYLEHDMGAYHPESPERLEAIYAMLEEPDMKGVFEEVPVRPARKEELLLVHSRNYIESLAATEGKACTYLDPDTQTCARSYEAALLAAGGLCEAIARVRRGDLDNAFALIRPPGHHAEKSRAMGFCLINNVAVGARVAQETLDIGRILIVDWDLHHGNGTQHAFEEDPSILYFSTHQYPSYPGTGSLQEVGRGKGEGFTVNVPLSAGCGDGEYAGFFEKILKPVAFEYKPEFVLVSAGFDIYREDPLGGMKVSPRGFAGLTRSLMDIADECCGGKMVITLEGGYHVRGQKESVKRVLNELSGISRTDPAEIMKEAVPGVLQQVIQSVGNVHRRYWKNL
ncbi:MAG: histone deacetylase [Pseudomonadota bacterium]